MPANTTGNASPKDKKATGSGSPKAGTVPGASVNTLQAGTTSDTGLSDPIVSEVGGKASAVSSSPELSERGDKGHLQDTEQWINIQQPMPLARSIGALYFDGREATQYLKSLVRLFRSRRVVSEDEMKQWVIEYAEPSVAWNLERLPGYASGTFKEFSAAIQKEYQSLDSHHRLHTVGYLDTLIHDFRLLQATDTDPTEVHRFCRAFKEVATNCKNKGDLTDRQIVLRFLFALPVHLKKKAMEVSVQQGGGQFNTDNLAPFSKVFKAVETRISLAKDIDTLVKEQSIGNDSSGYSNINHFTKPVLPTIRAGDATRFQADFTTYRDNAPATQIRRAFQDDSKTARPSTSKRVATPVSEDLIPTIQKIKNSVAQVSDHDLDVITKGLGDLQILQGIAERISDSQLTFEINSIRYTEHATEEALVQWGESQPTNRSSRYNRSASHYGNSDRGCKWCLNKRLPGMRPQAFHQYMNQCHDYKKFIGLGIIHEADDNNYICIGPWEEGKPKYPVMFPNSDVPRRQEVLKKVLNTVHSPDPARRAQAEKDFLDSQVQAALAREPTYDNSIDSLEVELDLGPVDTSDILAQVHNEDTLARIQSLYTQTEGDSDTEEFQVQPVETRARSTASRKQPYSTEAKLQDRIKAHATYGRPKFPEEITEGVQFTEAQGDTRLSGTMDVDDPKESRKTPTEILKRNTKKIGPSKPPSAMKPSISSASVRKAAKELRPTQTPPSVIPKPSLRRASTRNPRVHEALFRNGYRHENVLDKLLNLKEIPGNLTLGELIVLIDPPKVVKPPTGTIDQMMLRHRKAQQVEEAKVQSLEVSTNSDDILQQRPILWSPPTNIDKYEEENAKSWGYDLEEEAVFQRAALHGTPTLEMESCRQTLLWEKTQRTAGGGLNWYSCVQKLETYQQSQRAQNAKSVEFLISRSVFLLLISSIPFLGLPLLTSLANLWQPFSRYHRGTCKVSANSTSASVCHSKAFSVNPIETSLDGTQSYHSPTPKLVVTMPGRTTISDVRATLDTGAEVSCMTLEAAVKLELAITNSHNMALKTITGTRSRFLGFADNIPVAVGNCVVHTRFYIMDTPGVKIILGFPFFRKSRLTFRYPSDYDGGKVLADLWDSRSRLITTVKTNDATEEAKDAETLKKQHTVGMVYQDEETEYDSQDEFSGNE
jgi:hypothetical protein